MESSRQTESKTQHFEQLEDHVGNILRKAREQVGLFAEEVARRLGIEPTTLSYIEQTGQIGHFAFLYETIGAILRLDHKKLKKLADGWRPQPVDVSLWRELRLITCERGARRVHCYVVWDEASCECAVFDCGYDGQEVIEFLHQAGLKPTYLFITHWHPGHAGGVAAVRSAFPGIRVRATSESVPLYERNKETDFIPLGRLRILLRMTPGHTIDSTTYIIGNWPEDAPYVAIVGDALFAGSMGSVPSGAGLEARSIIRERILSLPHSTLLCPGHGPLTTVMQELSTNPFF